MGRKILAIVTAMITAVGIIWIGYMVGTSAAPFYPKNLEYMSAEERAAYAASMPVLGLIIVAVGYFLAAFAGGFISTKMGRRWDGGMKLALVVGVLLTVGSLLTTLYWPQPLWFVLVSVVLFIPVSLFGYKLATHAV